MSNSTPAEEDLARIYRDGYEAGLRKAAEVVRTFADDAVEASTISWLLAAADRLDKAGVV